MIQETNENKQGTRKRPSRLRLVPFKILSLLLYGEYPWLQLDDQGLIVANLSQMARAMRVSRDRLNEHLQWLADWDYLDELHLGRFRAKLRLSTPANLEVQYSAEREAALMAIQQREALRAALIEESSDE